MASVPNEILMIIKKLKSLLIADGLSLERVILFGSFAQGTAGVWSDIDLALVSRDFTGSGFFDRKKINPVIIKTDSRIEPHPFTPEGFTEDNPFVKEILRRGVEL